MVQEFQYPTTKNYECKDAHMKQLLLLKGDFFLEVKPYVCSEFDHI